MGVLDCEIPNDRVAIVDNRVSTIIDGLLYTKFSEHCDHQGYEVVYRAIEFCRSLPGKLCLVRGGVVRDGECWFFELWLVHDKCKEFVKIMKKEGFYLPDKCESSHSSNRISVRNLTLSCGGCPTIYKWEDRDLRYQFRLRHGSAKIEELTSESTVLHATMEGFDGVCDFSDVIAWAMSHGIWLM